MRAELILRIAADPSAVSKLSSDELCLLLSETTPPAWVFEEVARRRNDERVIAHLFSHPAVEVRVLERAFSSNNPLLLDRLRWHIRFSERTPELADVFAHLIPEDIASDENAKRLDWLEAHCSPLYLSGLAAEMGEVPERPRHYAPLARFLLLNDFLHYLECDLVSAPNDLPVMAKVALALNRRQPLHPFLNDADLRVRRAAQERQAWNEN